MFYPFVSQLALCQLRSHPTTHSTDCATTSLSESRSSERLLCYAREPLSRSIGFRMVDLRMTITPCVGHTSDRLKRNSVIDLSFAGSVPIVFAFLIFHDFLSGSRSVRLPLHTDTHSSVLSTTYLISRTIKQATPVLRTGSIRRA